MAERSVSCQLVDIISTEIDFVFYYLSITKLKFFYENFTNFLTDINKKIIFFILR